MQLGLSSDQQLLVASFARFFGQESSISRVRAAEPLGFDAALWASLGEMGVLAMRLPGDEGQSLFDTALVMEVAGRHLASGPAIEGLLAARLLALLAPDHPLAEKAASGEAVVVLAPVEAEAGRRHLVPGAAVADAVLFLAGDRVGCIEPRVRQVAPANHGHQPLAGMVLLGAESAPSTTLARGAAARRHYLQAIEEWKLLTAAMLNGIARRAIELAAEYATERRQFGRPIGSFQAVAHPLADRIIDVECAEALLWSALRRAADGRADAAAEISFAYWWSARTSSDSVARAMHTFGGYGVTVEYDVQLYHRRAKALALILGDPADELLRGGRRLWLGEEVWLPDVGAVPVDFDLGPAAKALADETRDFFEANLTPEWHAKSHYSYDGHDWDLFAALGRQKLLYPQWAPENGGRGADRYAAAAALEVWDEYGVTAYAQSTSNMVGLVMARFGTPEVQARHLPDLAAGKIISCLGYTEPASGSDSFAASTRAVRDGDEWVVNGQKMFTSGADLSSHVLLLTRTDPHAPKHAGLTLFIVPMDDPGVLVQRIETYQDEPTTATYYRDVRVPDAYRIGEVNGASKIFAWALSLEQGGSGFYGPHRHTVDAAIEWARTTERAGRKPIEDPRVLERLARAETHARASALCYYRSLWLAEEGIDTRASGPMSKVFCAEVFLRDATDLFELAAPDSLLRGKRGLAEIELAARHASVTTIYAGTSEIHRSQVAEKALGLPRSR